MPEEEKKRLLKTSHALIITSIREGWGLVVTEANAMGTPAIGYDVAGLRDSIRDKDTGILVESGNIQALGEAMIRFLGDQKMQKRLSNSAWEWSKEFTWDNSAKVLLGYVKEILAKDYHKG